MDNNEKSLSQFVPRHLYLHNWKHVYLNDHELIKEEFKAISNPNGLTTHSAHHPKNTAKNRYKTLPAYDHNRVKLRDGGDEESDYINASYIEDHKGKLKYIAAQAPVKDTVVDFWRMITENKVKAIVCLTKVDAGENMIKSKCYPYWNDNETERFGDYFVHSLSNVRHGDWVERKLLVTYKKDDDTITHYIDHYHYTEWPDEGVPSSTAGVIALIKKISTIYTHHHWPILVHCTAGIGRTGTFICIEQAIQVANDFGEQMREIKHAIHKLRHQRINLVETWEQYRFIHEALLDYNWDT